MTPRSTLRAAQAASQEVRDAEVFFLAQALAYKGIIATLPVAGLALGLLGVFFGGSAREDALALIREFIPAAIAGPAAETLAEAAEVHGAEPHEASAGSEEEAVGPFDEAPQVGREGPQVSAAG